MFLARQLISSSIPVVKPGDSGTSAMNIMEIYKVAHLPIVNNKEYLGLISDSDIFNLPDPEAPVANNSHVFLSPYINDNQHIYEALNIFTEFKLTVLPVLEKKGSYLGCITLHDICSKFSILAQSSQPGAIIVIRLSGNDYFLSQISRIIEENGAKILSLFIFPLANSIQFDLNIKINERDTSSIIQSLERFNYQVINSFQDENKLDVLLEDRFKELMRYLNV